MEHEEIASNVHMNWLYMIDWNIKRNVLVTVGLQISIFIANTEKLWFVEIMFIDKLIFWNLQTIFSFSVMFKNSQEGMKTLGNCMGGNLSECFLHNLRV